MVFLSQKSSKFVRESIWVAGTACLELFHPEIKQEAYHVLRRQQNDSNPWISGLVKFSSQKTSFDKTTSINRFLPTAHGYTTSEFSVLTTVARTMSQILHDPPLLRYHHVAIRVLTIVTCDSLKRIFCSQASICRLPRHWPVHHRLGHVSAHPVPPL